MALNKVIAKNHDEWLELRKKGIGGSDVGAVCGVSNFATPLDVFNKKLGLVEDTDMTERMLWGQILEDAIAREYSRRNNVNIRKRNTTFFNDERPFMLANIDRWIDGEKTILEVKTADRFAAHMWGEDGSDEVPESYLLQVLHYMSVLDVDNAVIAVLIGGNDYRQYPIKRNRQLEKRMIEIETNFWLNNVEKQTPPEPKTLEDVDRLFNRDNGLIVDVSEEDFQAAVEHKKVSDEIKELEKRKDDLTLQLKKALGENSVMRFNGKPIVTWKNTKARKRFDSKSLQREMPEVFSRYETEDQPGRMFLNKVAS